MGTEFQSGKAEQLWRGMAVMGAHEGERAVNQLHTKASR